MVQKSSGKVAGQKSLKEDLALIFLSCSRHRVEELKEPGLCSRADLDLSGSSTTKWWGDFGQITTSFCHFPSLQQGQSSYFSLRSGCDCTRDNMRKAPHVTAGALQLLGKVEGSPVHRIVNSSSSYCSYWSTGSSSTFAKRSKFQMADTFWMRVTPKTQIVCLRTAWICIYSKYALTLTIHIKEHLTLK